MPVDKFRVAARITGRCNDCPGLRVVVDVRVIRCVDSLSESNRARKGCQKLV